MKRRQWLGLIALSPGGQCFRTIRRQAPAEDGGEQKKSGEEPRVNQIEVTLHEFHEDLKLTDAQEPAWEGYVEKLRALARDVARESRFTPPQLGLVQQIDRIVDSARNRLTALEESRSPRRCLYAGLTPEQQKMADRVWRTSSRCRLPPGRLCQRTERRQDSAARAPCARRPTCWPRGPGSRSRQ